MCLIYKEWMATIDLVTDKLIIPLDGLKFSNSPRQIDNTKYTTLATGTIMLDGIFHNYFKDSSFEDVICENCSAVSSEAIK